MGACLLDLSHPWHRRWQCLGLLHARLGRLVVLGPGRERLADAMADGYGTAALLVGAGEARRTRQLDDPARHYHVLAEPDRHLPGALWIIDQRARLCPRCETRCVYSR